MTALHLDEWLLVGMLLAILAGVAILAVIETWRWLRERGRK